MSAKDDIQHFLLVFEVVKNSVKIERFGTDYEAALDAYDQREREYRDNGRGDDVDIVLLGADSLDTVKRTHSSYFGEDGAHGFAPLFKDALAGVVATQIAPPRSRQRR
jgi:hypothetical protein